MISDDFSIHYTDKRVYHSSGTTVYDVNDLYSWLMDIFDELDQMDDPVPMSAQTPTEYTMINEWFIDDESVKYLKNGAIKTSGYNGKIQVLELLESGYTNCVAGDIGKQVKDDTVEIGVLLAYNNLTRKWWVRSASTIADASAMTITDGTGAGTADGASVTGEDLFANVYTLGTIESLPYPQVYIFQGGESIVEWSELTNWDRGHIDVLIKVKEAGVEIDGAIITVFARQSGDLYDNFEIDLSAGGRNAVPLSSADDLNENTGDYYLLYDAEVTAFTTLGQIITGGTSGATAELVAATDWGPTGVLTLRGVKGTFQDNETITGSTEGSATVNGTVGDTYLAYDVETGAFTVGNVVTSTSGAKRILRGLQDDGTSGRMVLQVDITQTGSNRDPYYKVFQDNEAITDTGTGSATADGVSITVVSGFSDITISFVNGTATKGSTTGTFIEGERVTWPTGQSGILLKDTGSVITLGNCTDTVLNTKTITGDISGATCACSQDLQSAHSMDKAFEQQSVYPYDVIVEAGEIYAAGRTLAQVYEYFKFITQEDSAFEMYTVVSAVVTILDGEEYIIAYTGYTPAKSAPLGTFAGGKYFGAQGVWIGGMASGQSYQYADSNGTIRQPYASITVKVTSVVSGDRVAVFRTSTGVIDKAMYSSHATENTSTKTTFEVQEALAVDTPSVGIIRIIDMGTLVEQRHSYASWTGKIFSGLSPALQQDYDGDDKCYIPFIDAEAATTYVEKVVLYAADRAVLVRVRKKGILPFETPGTVGTAGLIVAAIRTADGIVTI
ncbi:MAG: hypothetical protein E3J60_04505 [Dehalococcoidia bacterium]|nr:MAG: hypothetical protein E3J60_04505 [Dehalococcoidia bacterium]